jgi:plasmid stabilization system protein ParE
MAYQIIWTENAETDLQALLDYWSESGAIQIGYKFLDNLYQKIELLAAMPLIGVSSAKISNVHRLVLTYHQVLYYHINEETLTVTHALSDFQIRKLTK